ncbi:hypothetical protein Aduo_007784 [Ancylostoma duodenale]
MMTTLTWMLHLDIYTWEGMVCYKLCPSVTDFDHKMVYIAIGIAGVFVVPVTCIACAKRKMFHLKLSKEADNKPTITGTLIQGSSTIDSLSASRSGQSMTGARIEITPIPTPLQPTENQDEEQYTI